MEFRVEIRDRDFNLLEILENEILRKNVSELQEQLQNAYGRIKDLTDPKQLELDL